MVTAIPKVSVSIPCQQCRHLMLKFEQRVKQAPRKAEVNVSYSRSARYSLLQLPSWATDSDENDQIQEGPTKSSKAHKARRKDKEQPLNNKVWPRDTHLFCVVGKTIPLKQQDPRIQSVVRIAITRLLGDLLFEDSFPDHEERIHLSRNAIIAASKSYCHDTMMQRLQNDLPYLELVAKVVRRNQIMTEITNVTSSQAENWISQYRSGVKAVAAIHVLTKYSLKADCGDKAAELLEGHTYIFPVKNGKVRCPCCVRKQMLNSKRSTVPSHMATASL
jgi:hypothetical protein